MPRATRLPPQLASRLANTLEPDDDEPVSRATPFVFVFCLGACSPHPTSAGGSSTVGGPPEINEATASSPAPERPVADQPDPGALGELLAAAPSGSPAPTGPDGGTLVGSDTGRPEGRGTPAPAPASSNKPQVHVGAPDIQPLLSSPAIERTARRLIYWRLMQRCHGPDGKPPPADAVTLVFTIRGDGRVDPASVATSAAQERYRATAECVLREFSASPFRGPAATRRSSARVIVTWPSVD